MREGVGLSVLNKWKQWPVVSALLVIVNVVVYVLCSITGNRLYQAGVLDAWSVVVQKEYGRIVWAMFLHEGMSHILNNMFILFFLGSMLEKEAGHIWFGIIYMLSGIGGNLLSLWAKVAGNDFSVTLGASGAVFGLDGMLLAMVLFYGKRMPDVTPVRVLLMIGCSLYSGFAGRNIDNAAHVGGLITGFLLGTLMCLCCRGKQNK